jgi:hypothetical protein
VWLRVPPGAPLESLAPSSDSPRGAFSIEIRDVPVPKRHAGAKIEVVYVNNPFENGKPVSNVTTVGIDLAKNVFALHSVDSHGNVLVHRAISRSKLPLVARESYRAW